MHQNQKEGTIANHVSEALASFRDLKKSLSRFDTSDEDVKVDAPSDLLSKAEDDFTRFKMWVGNQAAHQSGPASLDHRLREAPHLQQQVIYLLSDMLESLGDSVRLVLGNFNKEHADETSYDGQDDEIESDFSDSDIDDGPSASSLSTLLADVGEAIDCLLRLSVAIANPAPHERFRRLGAGPSEDVSFYEPHDIAYVRDKFPNISDDLSKNLGKFITRRRQFFKYRKAHHIRLTAGLEYMVSDEQTDAARTEVIQKTVASSLPEQFKTMLDFDPQANVIDEDIRSDTGMSQTSYATSAGFLPSGLDDKLQEPPLPLRVPPLPSTAENGIFVCPFCYRMISAKSRRAWKRHVFGDLRPYTCLLSPCTESNTDFDRRHNFQSHVLKYHWKSWSCPFKCEGSFSSAAELAQHVKAQHLQSGTEDEIRAVVSFGEESALGDTGNECLVCGLTVCGVKKYIKHVGRHLEQLALFALPSLDGEEELDDAESDEQNSAKSSLGANSSHDSSEALSPDLKPPGPIRTGTLDEEEVGGSSGDGYSIIEQRTAQIKAGKQPATPISSNDEALGVFPTNRDATNKTPDDTYQTEYQRVVSLMAFIEEHALAELRRLNAEFSDIRINDETKDGDLSLIYLKTTQLLDNMARAKKNALNQIDQLTMENVGKPSSEANRILRFIDTARKNLQQKMLMIEKEIDELTEGQADNLFNKRQEDAGTFEQRALQEELEARLEALGPEAEDKAGSDTEPKAPINPSQAADYGRRPSPPFSLDPSLEMLSLNDNENRGESITEENKNIKEDTQSRVEMADQKQLETHFAALQAREEEAVERRMKELRLDEEKRAQEHARAMAEAEEKARLRFEAEMKAAEDRRKAEAEARIQAEEEVRKRFEAAIKAAEEQRQAEERARAKREARLKFEAELRAAEEKRLKDEEERKRAEGLARVRFEKALQEEAEAKAAAAKKAQEEAERLMRVEQEAKAAAAAKAVKEAKKKAQPPLKFKDAVGRIFHFPFHLVETWAGMEELIKQAFLQVDILGPHIMEGHYDLLGPDGEIILPSVWGEMVQPGWVVTMQMWPMVPKFATSKLTAPTTSQTSPKVPHPATPANVQDSKVSMAGRNTSSPVNIESRPDNSGG
ncbi:transcription factor [Fusarium austroafricanum]|uniref:Transcription factor n=1 Tax=Fusarium austroafricanum TaxID=2364996 RepID=A0A8H4K8S2_9HYPO|nr:transcription factor [Fusarium austroafricanum]